MSDGRPFVPRSKEVQWLIDVYSPHARGYAEERPDPARRHIVISPQIGDRKSLSHPCYREPPTQIPEARSSLFHHIKSDTTPFGAGSGGETLYAHDRSGENGA